MSPFVARDFVEAVETPEALVGMPDITIQPEWEGERCFIIANGESVTPVRPLIAGLKGRVIAIKLSAALRPDADVMFISGKRAYEISLRSLGSMRSRAGAGMRGFRNVSGALAARSSWIASAPIRAMSRASTPARQRLTWRITSVLRKSC
jgi:hypothetical protein